MGRRRQRRARRAPQHEVFAAAADLVRHVRVALADPLRLDRPGAEPVLVEEGLERRFDDQRGELLLGRLLGRVDDLHGAQSCQSEPRRGCVRRARRCGGCFSGWG
jgi:hypothetical protein